MTQKHWKIYSQMKSLKKNELRDGFIDNFQKLKNRKRHLSLRLLWFQKIDEKSMSISLQTYDKTGGGRTLRNCCGGREKQIIMIFVEKALVLMWAHKSGAPTDIDSHEER